MQPSVARGWGRSQAVWGFYSKPLEKFKGARVGGGSWDQPLLSQRSAFGTVNSGQ